MTPKTARFSLNGVEVTGLSDFGRAALRRETLAVVFQQFNLIPSLTIRANVAFQARLAGRFDPVWQEELIHRLGLENLTAAIPSSFPAASNSAPPSGGRSPFVRVSCWRMSPPATSTKPRPTISWSLRSTSSPRRAALS